MPSALFFDHLNKPAAEHKPAAVEDGALAGGRGAHRVGEGDGKPGVGARDLAGNCFGRTAYLDALGTFGQRLGVRRDDAGYG